MANTILVTGGAGFIGSNFIKLILSSEPDVRIINLDALTYAGNLENLRDIENHTNYEFVHGRIEDAILVRKIIEDYRIDGIINFAAESHVDRSIAEASPFIETNIKGTLVLLEAVRDIAGVKRFLQVSTDEVYGSLGPNGYFTESTAIDPRSPYSASKAAGDHLVMAFVNTYGIDGLITRCSNNYGPYQFPEKLIPLMILNALGDKRLPVYGDGMNVRDWIYVDDHCRGIWLAYQRGRGGEVYNMGGNCEMQNIDVVRGILRELDKPEGLIEYVKDRAGHDRRYAIDSGKIEGELGWRRMVGFEDGLRSTVRWYLENPLWCANVRSGAYMEYYEKQYGNNG